LSKALIDQHPKWLYYLEQCPSTNTWAAEAIALQQGDVVFTRQQTAGRGRHGRSWHSPPGVLTASFVLEPIPIKYLSGISLAAGLAVIDAVEDLMPTLQGELRLKWTNDVFLQGRKLAGILCESAIKSSVESARVIVGVGLNRCVEFEHLEWQDDFARRVSLHQVASSSRYPQGVAPSCPQGVAPDELPLLERLRYYLLLNAERLRSQGMNALLPDLRQRDFLMGKFITVETVGESVAGEAVGIGDRGELRLRLLDGTERAFISGHILLP
jgi:BirA family transcriptional regulator, biotin operon repressor / biotin---[acetyl-CoA-carboxylase] ligase